VNDLLGLIRERRIIVCCGSGGVGKTTMAAAMAVEGARQGRRTCVVTIDPARRLADAFGLDSLTNTPRRVNGAWDGELWALMLDTKATFDAAVIRYAPDEAQAQAILESRHYRNLCNALSGTQEYMAVEMLYQLDQEGGFDLIVVDTRRRDALWTFSVPPAT
jgi:anion-transporting  ArsA/GET3 family ATPase